VSTPYEPTDPDAGRDAPAQSGSSSAAEPTAPGGSSSWTPPPYGQDQPPPQYGQQQPPPYGQQQPPPYGQQQPPPYGQQGQPGAWGAQPTPYQPGMAVAPNPEAYASWGQRVAAFLIDRALVLPPIIIGYVLIAIGIANTRTVRDPSTGLPVTQATGVTALMAVGYAVLLIGTLAIDAWNRWYKAGTTGQSVGKRVMGLKLVRESDGAVLGFGMAFVRDLAHVIDGAICYIGYLFPLWDAKRQTIADKVVSTVVYPGVPKGS